MSGGKFVKKPIEVEAFHLESDTVMPEFIEFLGADWLTKVFVAPWDRDTGFDVTTLEGKVRVHRGDWIVRGVVGELYRVRPDIFEATYEPAEETLARQRALYPEMWILDGKVHTIPPAGSVEKDPNTPYVPDQDADHGEAPAQRRPE